MKILEQSLSKIKSINKKQRDFFIILIQGLIGAVGKKTFRNLARFMPKKEYIFSRQMTKAFDFLGLNALLIETAKNDDNDVLIAAQDTTFIPKSGKKTEGIGFFWNGSAGRAEKGLELDVIAAIKVNEKKEGYTLSSKQAPANQKPKTKEKNDSATKTSKIDFYLDHLKQVIKKFFELGIKHIVADAFYAKEKYVNGVVSLGLHVISRLRKDARFRYLYNGPQKSRGRKKQFDIRKVNFDDFTDRIVTQVENEQIELLSHIVYSVSLKRLIKVVLVRKVINPDKYAAVLLFSTDIELDALTIFQYYSARFQIEFIFRDAKGFTGLADCQSRDSRRLDYHFNASLTALNIVKLQDRELQQKEKTQHPFSITNWTRKYHAEIVIDRIISTFGLDQTLIKSHPDYQDMLTFSNVRH